MSQTRPLLERLLPAPHHVIRFPDLKQKFKPQRAKKRTQWINNFFLAVLILIAIWVFAFGVSLSIKAYEEREDACNHTYGAVSENTQKQKLPARITAAGLSADAPSAGNMSLTRNFELEALKRRPEVEKPRLLEIVHDVKKIPDFLLSEDSIDEHLQKPLESFSPDEVAHGPEEDVYYNMEGNYGEDFLLISERPSSKKHHKKKKHRKSFAVRRKPDADEQDIDTVRNKKGRLVASTSNGSFSSDDFDHSLPNAASEIRADNMNPNHGAGLLFPAQLEKENSSITGKNTFYLKTSDMSSRQMVSGQTINSYQERARRSIEPVDGDAAESKEHNVVKKVLPDYGRNQKKKSEHGNGNMIPNNSSPKSEGSTVKHYFMDPLQLKDRRASKKRVHRTRRESPAETQDTRKSVEKIRALKSEAEQKEAAAKADRLHEARAAQLEKDRALMSEMFDNVGEETSDADDFAEDDRSTENTEDMDSSEDEEQSPSDYVEAQESFADAEAGKSYARSEPYAPVASQEAEDFDTDDITKKQHDNSKAQWPHRWADKFKNLVNGENYHNSDSAQQFDDYGSNDYEQASDSGLSSEEESFDQESQYEESDDSKHAESDDSSSEAGSADVQLDTISEDEKDEMQFTDTSKNQYQEYDTSNAQMDAEQLNDHNQIYRSDRSEKGREKDAVSRELARFFGRPQKVDRQRGDVSYRSFPQEDVNLLKEVMLTPLLLQPSVPVGRARQGRPQTRFSTESDVKITPRTRPSSLRDRPGTPSSALVRNVLTLNINFGPDAMVKMSPDDDGDDETDDRSPKQGKTINLNVMRTGKLDKDIAADLRNEGQDQKARRKQAVADSSAHRDSEESEDDAEDDDPGDDGFPGRKKAYTNEQQDTSQVNSKSNRILTGGTSGQRRKRIPLPNVEQFDMDLTETRSNEVRPFPPRSNLIGDVIAIKLGSINGDGGQQSN